MLGKLWHFVEYERAIWFKAKVFSAWFCSLLSPLSTPRFKVNVYPLKSLWPRIFFGTWWNMKLFRGIRPSCVESCKWNPGKVGPSYILSSIELAPSPPPPTPSASKERRSTFYNSLFYFFFSCVAGRGILILADRGGGGGGGYGGGKNQIFE